MSKTKNKHISYPDEVRDAVKKSADENGRSENKEIIYQLKKAYKIR